MRIHYVNRYPTKTEACNILGIKSYDTALPQPWLDVFIEVVSDKTNYDLSLSSYVWCYDNDSFSGYPHPLTLAAYAWLKAYDQRQKTNLADHIQFDVLKIEE